MRSFFTIWLLTFFSATLFAGDWPMWRYDAARSAASPDNIADNPILLWSRKLPPVRPAWPLDLAQRLNFDGSYEPVVMGKLMFIGSPNDGSITAYDTDTGEEKWKFYTEGPVRCAPVCWSSPGIFGFGGKDKIYAGSDDGFLYCLNAKTGKLLWKFRGAPADRPDRRQLGNGHLVSFWPVRGGPVVKDDIVYFGAGIWPIFGVFIYALDAKTGKVKWINSDINYIANVPRDHDERCESGLSPQGHFIAIRDKLLVPCGRSMPAGIELATGKLTYYAQGNKNGNCRVAAHGDYAFVGKNAIVNLYDFREAGSKWAYGGSNVPAGYQYKGPGSVANADLWESPDTRAYPYKTQEACDASSAFENGMAYGLAKGVFYAYDLKCAKIREHKVANMNGYTNKQVPHFYSLLWDAPELWQFKTPHMGKPSNVIIKAGQRLYGNIGKKLIAIENLAKEPKVAWEKDIPGTAASIIAADGKLIVATEEGGIYCFGAGATGRVYEIQALALEPRDDGWSVKANNIIQATGVKAGYCLVLGLTDGRLVEELLKQTNLLVIAVDADAAKIETLRRRFDAAGCYGSRVELFAGNPYEFPFPPYIASLIVSENTQAKGFPSAAQTAKLFKNLRPYGGTLCLQLPVAIRPQYDEWSKAATLAGARVRRVGDWCLTVREGALPGSTPWTHDAADAANTYCSQDNLVQAPLGILWYGDVDAGREGVNQATLKKAVYGGRVYTLRESRAVLIAHDAYTGRFLWRNNIGFLLARMAVMSDGIYVAGVGKCIVCDPETGATIKTFIYNTSGALRATDIRVDGDVILVACSDQDANWYQSEGFADGNIIVCLDRQTGAELWRRNALERFTSAGIAMGAGMVFCTDSMNYAKAKKADLKEVESKVFALDARTGNELWSNKTSYALVGGDDWIGYASEAGAILAGRGGIGNALDAKSGKTIWAGKNVGSTPLIIRGKTFINRITVVFDIATAEKIRQISQDGLGQARWPFFGCNNIAGGKHLLMARNATIAYCDINGSTTYHLRNIRSGCVNSLIAADGLLNVPNFAPSCGCNYSIYTSLALINMPEVASWSGTKPLVMTPPPPLPGMESKIERFQAKSTEGKSIDQNKAAK